MRIYENIKAWLGEVLMGALWTINVVSNPLGMRRIYRLVIIHLIQRCEIFDPSYYLEFNTDVGQTAISPLRHYASFGDREGRAPMAFFDPLYYRAHTPGRTKRVNALLHYAYVGRYRRISPSPWFDVDYYLNHNKDVARARLDPLVHYLKWGGVEGRSPCPQFNGAYYLRTHPDVAAMRINPLIHYLFFGRLEGLSTFPGHGGRAQLDLQMRSIHKPVFMDQDSWSLLRPRRNIEDAGVDVVVPVYKARVETLRCLYSVLSAACQIPYELIVINDASPDMELVADLQRLAGLGLFTLLSNSENHGFVYTVNRGMALHAERDVVLLNSDTEVYDGWLDRLSGAAHRNERTGTVTPLSNNATICSYPCFLYDNPYPLELPYDQLDALTAVTNQAVEVEAPTGVGFCIYIRRDCLNAVGFFDEATFGRGYGEENDFCQRAIAKGWRNLITADTFIRHWGSASFQGERAKRVDAALKALDQLHPNYRRQVDDFIKQDPLANARERLDWARLLRHVKTKNVLIVCHGRGGGTERHVQEDTLRLLREGTGVFYLRPVAGNPTHVRIRHPKCSQLINLKSYPLADVETLAQVLAELGITRIHTHGLVDFAINAPEYILKLVQYLKAEFWVDLHDYKVICPRINLTSRSGRYCGEPAENFCNLCCETEGNDFGATDIKTWRQIHYQVLQQADKIWVPDLDMQIRLSGYFPGISLSLSPHEDIDIKKVNLMPPTLTSDGKLRIAVIGSIGKAKGFDIFNACAADAKKRNLPLEFVLLGYSLKDKALERCGVKITGRYLEHEAQAKLKELAPHVVWLPSTWPETYSYTLSLAIKGGYPTFAFDLGAIATRLRALGQEHSLMPLQMLESPHIINDRFVNYLNNCQSKASLI